jgi:hypothetical protein
MSRANNTLTCHEIEHILLKKSIEEISIKEQQIIEQHLRYCHQCKRYEHFLVDIKRAFTTPQNNNLEPLHEIRENALKIMSGYRGVFSMLWNSIIGLFEYRIPIYQPMAVILIIFVLLVGFKFAGPGKNIFVISGSEDNKSHGMILNESFALDSLQVLERQRIGKNVLEDSVLTNFTTTAM